MKLAMAMGCLLFSVRLSSPHMPSEYLALHTRRISTDGNDSFPLSRIYHKKKKKKETQCWSAEFSKCTARGFFVHVSKDGPLGWAFLLDTPRRTTWESLMFLSEDSQMLT